MKILVACEFSGTVRDAFIRHGHDALSCDLLPSETPGPHYQGDVLDLLHAGWDLMIAHPPCTYLTNSGVKHLYEEWTWQEKINGEHKPTQRSPRIDKERWHQMELGAKFFMELWNAPIPRIAIENPVMHGFAKERVDGGATQFVQPWEYGHPESKRTGLRLKNLPPLEPTNNVYNHMMTLPRKQRERVHYLPPGPDRWKERSRTYPGIAEAMATQWTS